MTKSDTPPSSTAAPTSTAPAGPSQLDLEAAIRTELEAIDRGAWSPFSASERVARAALNATGASVPVDVLTAAIDMHTDDLSRDNGPVATAEKPIDPNYRPKLAGDPEPPAPLTAAQRAVHLARAVRKALDGEGTGAALHRLGDPTPRSVGQDHRVSPPDAIDHPDGASQTVREASGLRTQLTDSATPNVPATSADQSGVPGATTTDAAISAKDAKPHGESTSPSLVSDAKPPKDLPPASVKAAGPGDSISPPPSKSGSYRK